MKKTKVNKEEAKKSIHSAVEDLLFHFSYGFINHLNDTITVDDPVFTGDMALKYIKEWMKENVEGCLDEAVREISENIL